MNEIEISEKSKEYVDEIFSRYTKIDIPDEVEVIVGEDSGRVILHLYPVRDTKNDDNDDLDGYEDALLFDVHVYDVQEETRFVIESRDHIEIPDVPVGIRIFKDKSTMIIIDRPVWLELYQNMRVTTA